MFPLPGMVIGAGLVVGVTVTVAVPAQEALVPVTV
jgi:hypothetical protein